MSQNIRVKLKSYEHALLDRYMAEIVKAVISTNAVVNGPIPLPTKKRVDTVLRSPHVHKKSRDQYELLTHARVVDIYGASSKTVEDLMKLNFPSGIEIELKV